MATTMPSVIRPRLFTPFTQVAVGQSTRHGGVSPAPFHSLNLGKSTGDDPANVAENRRRLCEALGFSVEQMAWSKQVHGDQVRLVTAPGASEGYDALITNVPGILLAVSVADCTPILLYDVENNAVAAIHAGWRGTAAGIVTKTLEQMAAAYGSSGAHIRAYVGACIDECSFEVGDEVAENFADAFKRFDPGRGKYFVDLKKANAAQCLDFGVPADQIELSPFSTVTDNQDFFSHRKEQGITGRGLGVVGLHGDSIT